MARPYLLKKRGRFWYMKLAGQSVFRSTGYSRRSDAEDEARRRLKAVQEPERTTGKTLREYAEPFYRPGLCPHLRRLQEEGKSTSPLHVFNSRSWIDRFILKDPIAELPVASITRADVLDFRSRLLAKLGERKDRVNRALRVLKVIIHEALYRQDIDRDPTSGVGHVKTERRSPGILSVEELGVLFPEDGLGPWRSLRANACFLLAATTGMRRGELLALRWEDVDFEAGAIRIVQAWKTPTLLGPPKSGKPRACPLPRVAAAVLRALHDDPENIRSHPEDLVFCYDDGSRLGDTWWTRNFAYAMESAGIDMRGRHVCPHSLRHTLNTLLEAKDYNPEKIRTALGWSGEGIRANYLHLSLEHIQEQAQIVDELFRPPKPAKPRDPGVN